MVLATSQPPASPLPGPLRLLASLPTAGTRAFPGTCLVLVSGLLLLSQLSMLEDYHSNTFIGKAWLLLAP